jgi:hypothetical protein
VLVLVAGFLALTALSATGEWDTGRSMWDYRSATWGDALVLPVIVGVLAAASIDERLPRRQRERAWAIVGTTAFGLAGLAVQVSWLAADDPILNWTLPEPHHFSFPGWYHAAFLICTSAAVGAMAFLAGHRIRAADPVARVDLARHPATAALAGCAIAFGVLLALDSADSVDTAAGQGSTAGATASLAFTFVLAVVALGLRPGALAAARGVPVAALIVGASLVSHGWPG